MQPFFNLLVAPQTFYMQRYFIFMGVSVLGPVSLLILSSGQLCSTARQQLSYASDCSTINIGGDFLYELDGVLKIYKH